MKSMLVVVMIVMVGIGLLQGMVQRNSTAFAMQELPRVDHSIGVASNKIELNGEYTCTEGQNDRVYGITRVTLKPDQLSVYRQVEPESFEFGVHSGSWQYVPEASAIFLDGFDYDWDAYTMTLDANRNFSASIELTPSYTNWIKCTRLEFTHTIHAPILHEQPSLDMSGIYSCVFYEYGVTWKVYEVTLNPDGTSFYAITGSQYEPEKGMWVFKEGANSITLTNFMYKATVDREKYGFSKVYYGSDGKTTLEQYCYPR